MGVKAKKHLGTVEQIHSSGMVETDKGYKYPNVSAKIGDVMYEENHNVYFMDKKEWQDEPKRRTRKSKKQEVEAEEEIKVEGDENE